MDYYIDIRLRLDPDFPPAMLMSALYGKLHRALFDLEANDIGVSFPDHKTGVRARTPGDRLRIHGERGRLDLLMARPWLKGINELVDCSEISAIPAGAQHRNVRRRQFNTGSPSRAKRYAKRHDMTQDDAQALYQDVAQRRIELPFVQMASRSSSERFALFIDHGKPQPQPSIGQFNHYGLSKDATIPWF